MICAAVPAGPLDFRVNVNIGSHFIDYCDGKLIGLSVWVNIINLLTFRSFKNT